MKDINSEKNTNNTNRRICEWWNNILKTNCPACLLGKVYHSHSEPHGWTTVEVYICDKCGTQYI